jgi:hypothetical protein
LTASRLKGVGIFIRYGITSAQRLLLLDERAILEELAKSGEL